jgi:hypothetical protein
MWLHRTLVGFGYLRTSGPSAASMASAKSTTGWPNCTPPAAGTYVDFSSILSYAPCFIIAAADKSATLSMSSTQQIARATPVLQTGQAVNLSGWRTG